MSGKWWFTLYWTVWIITKEIYVPSLCNALFGFTTGFLIRILVTHLLNCGKNSVMKTPSWIDLTWGDAPYTYGNQNWKMAGKFQIVIIYPIYFSYWGFQRISLWQLDWCVILIQARYCLNTMTCLKRGTTLYLIPRDGIGIIFVLTTMSGMIFF